MEVSSSASALLGVDTSHQNITHGTLDDTNYGNDSHEEEQPGKNNQHDPQYHTAVVLFYKYFIPMEEYPFLYSLFECTNDNSIVLQKLVQYINNVCISLRLKGRVLVASEGINGTLSASSVTVLNEFIAIMNDFNLHTDISWKEIRNNNNDNDDNATTMNNRKGEYLFRNIDWKISTNKINSNDDNEKNSNSNTNNDNTIIADPCHSTGCSDEKKEECTSDDTLPSTTRPSSGVIQPFPDLKVTIVKEVISTGGMVSVQDIPKYGGTHLSPHEFHNAMQNSDDNDNIVLIDVRNTFEYNIGHFIHPKTNTPAINPETVQFSTFDDVFCKRSIGGLVSKNNNDDDTKNNDDTNNNTTDSNNNHNKNTKFLMYCTGGIRCEKASVMLKKRGYENVYQLRGGIHRYLEQYGTDGYFVGSNFVFDQRVSQRPSDFSSSTATSNTKNNTMTTTKTNVAKSSSTIVGKCIECNDPYDDLCGSRLCTVCRDLVLVCTKCQQLASLREYHCSRHSNLKSCYYTFLEVYDCSELEYQRQILNDLYNTKYKSGNEYRNIRKTISRQIDKITSRIEEIQSNPSLVNQNALRRCRTCMETSDICNGRCWGFWRTATPASRTTIQASSLSPPPRISIGDKVKPGPHWNELKLGPKTIPNADSNNTQRQERHGKVIEIKTWNNNIERGSDISVCWEDDVEEQSKVNSCNNNDSKKHRNRYPPIYRWGIQATNGQRMYDLRHV